MMITKILVIVIFTILLNQVNSQFDYDDESRRNHRRRPQHGNYNGNGYPYSNPCGRDSLGRFISLSYININCHSSFSGGGHFQNPVNDFPGLGGGGIGGGHRPQKPHRPMKPQRPILGGNHHNQGGFGGLGGFLGNRPQSILQDFTSNLGGFINRPAFSLPFGNTNNNNNNGLLGLGFLDGSIINSFANLFTTPINTNRPSSPSQVQYLEEGGNDVDDKPVHEDHDEITEPVVADVNVNDRFIGGYNYNRITNKVARSIKN